MRASTGHPPTWAKAKKITVGFVFKIKINLLIFFGQECVSATSQVTVKTLLRPDITTQFSYVTKWNF